MASREVHFVPTGGEVRMLRNGALLMSQSFPTGEEALTGADEELGGRATFNAGTHLTTDPAG